MDWIEAVIYTTREGIEPLSNILDDLSTGGFSVSDARDFEEFLSETAPKWDYVDDSLMSLLTAETALTTYLPQSEQGKIKLNELISRVAHLKEDDKDGAFGRLTVEVKGVREEDWENNWKQYFTAFNVGERLMVAPSWEECPDNTGRLVIRIDPGSSFGTGQHHTTRLCLEALERLPTEGARLLDLGCGSGILSIAALHLGAFIVTAVDIDQNAVRIAGENLAQNGFDGERVRLFSGNIIADRELYDSLCAAPFNIIAANIVADVLIAMAPLFPALLAPGGALLCSGIIEERSAEVMAALKSAGFTPVWDDCSGGWAAVTFRRG